MKARKGYRKQKKDLKTVVKKIVKKQLDETVEDKEAVYFALGPTVIDRSSTSTGSFLCLNAPQGRSTTALMGAQGSGGFQHIGNNIRIKKLAIKFRIYQTVAGASVPVRIMLIVDKSANGTAPVLNEILWDASTNDSAITSPYKIYYKDQYNVLYDKTFELNQYYTVTGAQANQRTVSINKKMNLKVEYYPDTVSTTIAGIQRNSIYLVMFQEGTSASFKNLQSAIIYEDA